MRGSVGSGMSSRSSASLAAGLASRTASTPSSRFASTDFAARALMPTFPSDPLCCNATGATRFAAPGMRAVCRVGMSRMWLSQETGAFSSRANFCFIAAANAG